jgi:hypothetical protein
MRLRQWLHRQTGVEAISNGITVFAALAVNNAKRTLTGVILVLGILLAGIAYLRHVYNPVAGGYGDALAQGDRPWRRAARRSRWSY